MLAFVKEPHIRLSMDGPTAALPPFIDFLRTQYTVEVEVSIDEVMNRIDRLMYEDKRKFYEKQGKKATNIQMT